MSVALSKDQKDFEDSLKEAGPVHIGLGDGIYLVRWIVDFMLRFFRLDVKKKIFAPGKDLDGGINKKNY
jgi:hypothetical protein